MVIINIHKVSCCYLFKHQYKAQITYLQLNSFNKTKVYQKEHTKQKVSQERNNV